MKNISKKITHLENGDRALNINNSNDFNRILDEIKLKQLQSDKITKKNTKYKVKTKNETADKDYKKKLEKNEIKYIESFNNRTNQQKEIQKHKSEEKIKKKIFDDTPIFPHITSLILDYKNENKNPESSNNTISIKDEKVKRNSSNNKIGNYTIYDIYTNTLKKLSINDENGTLKKYTKINYINENKFLENRKNNSFEGIKNKRNVNLKDENIFYNSFDKLSSNFTSRDENNSTQNRNNAYYQKHNKTKANGENYHHNDKMIYHEQENHNKKDTYSSDNDLYYNNSSRENYSVSKGNPNSSSDEYHSNEEKKKEEKINPKKKRENGEYNKENKNEKQNRDIEQAEVEYEDYYVEEARGDLIKIQKNHKINTNESKSSKNESVKLKGEKNTKKGKKTYIENSNKYTEAEKENDYLKTPFVLSIECLDENEKQEIEINEVKNKNIERMDQNQDNNILNSHDEEINNRNNSAQIPIQDIPTSNRNYSLNDRTHKKKKRFYGKQNINYSNSELTTTDSEYSFNENLNISYENFKTKNNKIFSIMNEKENKEDLLKVINNQNILSIRKILRIMRELYIGFLGLQLIYFITYILFGNNSVYLIQIISITCTFFSLLDANYHGYLLNGFIDICIAIFLNVAILQNVSGFKSLKNDDVLKNIAISNVVLLYLFSIFSFLNSYFIFRLHSLEKRSIKHVIKSIESRAEKNIKTSI